MDSGALVERLRRLPESRSLRHLQAFDPSNDLHLDEAARLLLERFRSQQDTESFTLLFELTHRKLGEIATRLTRKLSPSTDADDLAASFMARLFTDVGDRHHEPVRRFLGLAHTAMRNDVLDQLRHNKRAQAGVQRYHDTLRPPQDPAAQAQREEEHARLSDYGETVVRLTGECFHTLPTRDKHVLVAREILGMSYERVALILRLETDQVGMIIRRARDQLARRLLDRLAADQDLSDAGMAEARATVLRCLGSKERVKSMRTLVQGMLEKSAQAGRRRLADLMYEMAKACLLGIPGLQNRTLVRDTPRRRDIVAGDVEDLAARLHGLDVSVDVRRLTGPPSSAGALEDAGHCLEVLEQLEGNTGRLQVARALHAIYSGELSAAEATLRELIDADLPPVTRQNVYRNLTLTLLRQERFSEALELAEACGDEWPDDPARVMNVCFAAARLRDAPRFEANVRRLVRLNRRAPEERVRSWIENEVSSLATDLGLTPEDTAELVRPPGDSGRDGEP